MEIGQVPDASRPCTVPPRSMRPMSVLNINRPAHIGEARTGRDKMAGKSSSELMNLNPSSDEDPSPDIDLRRTVDVVEISSDSDAARQSGRTRVSSASGAREIIDGGTIASSNDGSSSEGEIAEETPVQQLSSNLVDATGNATSSDDEDGEVDGKAAQRSERAKISALMRSAGKDVAERDARFFSLQDVICSHCGTKGHLSYDCPEEVKAKRCFLCGREGHSSRKCPDEQCFVCRGRGHRAKDCPNANGGGKRVGDTLKSQPAAKKRRWSPPRFIAPLCYVCGSREHNDCSLGRMPIAEMSCYNCGRRGHTSSGCREPRAERWVRVARDMDMERKNAKKPGRKNRKPGETKEEKLQREKEKAEEIEMDKLEYRKELERRVTGRGGSRQNNSRAMGRGDRGNNRDYRR